MSMSTFEAGEGKIQTCDVSAVVGDEAPKELEVQLAYESLGHSIDVWIKRTKDPYPFKHLRCMPVKLRASFPRIGEAAVFPFGIREVVGDLIAREYANTEDEPAVIFATIEVAS
jgi:hypothetical protein